MNFLGAILLGGVVLVLGAPAWVAFIVFFIVFALG